MAALPRLYAILDLDTLDRRGLDPLAVVDGWLAAGVRLIQLRAKTQPSGTTFALATRLVERCHAAGATFVVNDRADIAALAGADGLHLGQDDLSPAAARTLVLPPKVIGFSTHSLDQVEAACREPIDYLAIGPVFATSSKINPDPVVGLDGVRAAVAAAQGLPVVGIGGITLEHAPGVIAAGAASVAIISDLLDDDVEARAKAYLRALQ